MLQFFLGFVEDITKFAKLSLDHPQHVPHFTGAFLNRQRAKAHLQAAE